MLHPNERPNPHRRPVDLSWASRAREVLADWESVNEPAFLNARILKGEIPPAFMLHPNERPTPLRRPVDLSWTSRAREVLANVHWEEFGEPAFLNAHVLSGQHRVSGIVSTILKADRVLQGLDALADEIAADRESGFLLGERLRATAEQDMGIPCVVYDAAPGADNSRRVGWALHRADVLEYAALDGTTQCVASYGDEVSRRCDLRQVESALADAANRVRAVKGAALVALKLLVGREYGFVDSVPPHGASPCGVLRLATPIVPGAPSVRSWPDRTTMTLAA
ncbi:hypothetical protein ACFCY8_13355 [Streptomyces noursei]|uniref:hypothetical protein n=1 Tax=Streptomyces noursei TaxID=1971 RepID=UPI0035DC2D21